MRDIVLVRRKFDVLEMDDLGLFLLTGRYDFHDVELVSSRDFP